MGVSHLLSTRLLRRPWASWRADEVAIVVGAQAMEIGPARPFRGVLSISDVGVRSRAWANVHELLGPLKTACLRVEGWRIRLIGREAAIIPFTGKGRLLDVGCGTGKALEAFREIGWDVTGVEINPQAASIARRRLGCQILLGGFEEVPLGDERFDVVRFCHNLEHLPSPRGALEKAQRILRPTGLVWIEVPNAASLERRLFREHWFGWGLP